MADMRVLFEDGLQQLAQVVLACRKRARSLWLIAPWFSTGSEKNDPLATLAEALAESQCTVYLLTRPPINSWHREAVDLLIKSANPIVLCNDRLHAKLYVLECEDFLYALMGSANLTANASYRNLELSIELRSGRVGTADGIAKMIAELMNYARSLTSEEDSKIYHKETHDAIANA